MDQTFNHSLGKKAAALLCKKAISGKVGILKDSGDVLKVGAPLMAATIEITDTEIKISGSAAASMIAQTCASEIEIALSEQSSSAPASVPSSNAGPVQSAFDEKTYFETQDKIIETLRKYKELFKEEIITEEEFLAKKKELLNLNVAVADKPKAEPKKAETSAEAKKEEPSQAAPQIEPASEHVGSGGLRVGSTVIKKTSVGKVPEGSRGVVVDTSEKGFVYVQYEIDGQIITTCEFESMIELVK